MVEFIENVMPMFDEFLQTQSKKQLDEERFTKLSKLYNSLSFLKENNLGLIVRKKQNISSNEWSIRVINDENELLGYFDIDCNASLGTLQLGISTIEEGGDESLLKGQGIARLMVAAMCLALVKDGKISHITQLYIDADASGGFWDAIGMGPHRYSDNPLIRRNIPGRGQEKMITFGDLSLWALGEIMGNPNAMVGACGILKLPTGGAKKNKTHGKHKNPKYRSKKSKKSKKSRKSRKSRK